ncbi:MAG TPA: type IV pilus twitching motility protein PilT [Dehalococcoidales bacterium]
MPTGVLDKSVPNQKIDSDSFLRAMVSHRASDLHLKAPTGPKYRIDGGLGKHASFPVTPQDVEDAFIHITTEAQRAAFYLKNELDFVYSIPRVARFRINVHRQRGTLSIAIRLIPFHAPDIDELGLPAICKELILKPRGLVLVTGPTGSGKSTTLAAMIQYLNQKENKRIITIEDPIEYVFEDENCVISQRELGTDTESFASALKHALRHDPDVIVVGEMRDIETMSTAVAAAETGHLVLSTLHTIDTAQAVDRLVDMFPASQQSQMRLQFSQLLQAVLCQVLVPRASGNGRVGAFEIMVANDAIRNVIREGKTFEIPGIMQLNRRAGMQSLNQHLADLVKEGTIKRSDAMLKTSYPDGLVKLIGNA